MVYIVYETCLTDDLAPSRNTDRDNGVGSSPISGGKLFAK